MSVALAVGDYPYVAAYPWTHGSGFGAKYADPTSPPANGGRDVAFCGSSDVAVAHVSTPYVTAYRWTPGSGFGAKYSNPGTLPAGDGSGVAFCGSSDVAVAHVSTPYVTAYRWTPGSGFGAKYSNPGTLPAGAGSGVAFCGSSDVAVAHYTSPYVTAYRWTPGSGFGAKYSNPGTLPPSTSLGVAFCGSTDIAVVFTNSPYVYVYHWTPGSGFGAKYSNPGTFPGSTCNRVAFCGSTDIAVASSSSPFVSAYPWTPGSGFGAKYSNPGTLPPSSGKSVGFCGTSDVVVGSTDVPYVTAYPWTHGSGFGAKYSNPIDTLPSSVSGVAWVDDPPPVVTPTVTTTPAVITGPTSVTLSGQLDDDGGEPCACWFEWGLTDTYGNSTQPSNHTTGQTFSAALSGLAVDTPCHYRAVAQNSAGRAYGEDMVVIPSRIYEIGRWTGSPGEGLVTDVVFDGTHIYATLDGEAAAIVKLDADTLAEVDRWTGDVDDYSPSGLCYDGHYLFLRLLVEPATVIKIDPATMTEVDRWLGGAEDIEGVGIVADGGGQVYTSLMHNDVPVVVQLQSQTMEEANRWVGSPATTLNLRPTCLTYGVDSGDIYVGFDMIPLCIRIDPAVMTETGRWMGQHMMSLCHAVVDDGVYTYALYDRTVVKCEIATMNEVARWHIPTGAAGGVLARVGASLYIATGFSGYPTTLYKICTSTMQVEGTWVAGGADQNPCAIIYDGSCLYIALYLQPATVIKIDPATMTEVGRWSSHINTERCLSLECNGLNIFVGVDDSDLARVVKLSPATMTEVGRWSSDVHYNPRGLSWNGSNLFVAVNTATAAAVVKLNALTMSQVSQWVGGAGDHDPSSLIWDDTFIVVGLSTSPARLVRINPSTMLEHSRWTAATEEQVTALLFSGSSYFVGTQSPCLIQLDWLSLQEQGRWTWDGIYQAGISDLVMASSLILATQYVVAPQSLSQLVKLDGMTLITRWPGEPGTNISRIAAQTPYLYAALFSAPAAVLQWGLAPIARWVAPDPVDASAVDLVAAGQHIWVGLGTDPPVVIKLLMQPAHLTAVCSGAMLSKLLAARCL